MEGNWFTAKIDGLNDKIDAVQTLKEHDLASIQVRFVDSKVALDAALNAANEALRRAETGSEKRFDTLGEIIDQLREQQGAFVSRAEIKAMVDAIQDNTQQNKDMISASLPRSEASFGFDRLHAEASVNYDRGDAAIKIAASRISILENANANMNGKMWAFGALFTIGNVAFTWWVGISGASHLVH